MGKIQQTVGAPGSRSTATLARGYLNSIWEFPDPVSSNNNYESLFLPKFTLDCLKTLGIHTLDPLEKFGSNLGRKEVKAKGLTASKSFCFRNSAISIVFLSFSLMFMYCFYENSWFENNILG